MKLSSLQQFCKNNPAFKIGGVQHLVFNRNTNGYSGCFPKIGRRRYVDEEKFFNRVAELNRKAA